MQRTVFGIPRAAVVAALLLGGCGGGGAQEGAVDPGAASEAGRQAAPAAKAGSTIRDDFSDPASGWVRRDNEERGADYRDGAYVVWMDNDASSYVGSSGTYESAEFGDTRFEVQATKRSGPPGAPIGLSCRQWSENQGERRGVYFADVDGEGEVRIGLYDEEGQEILAAAERPGLWRDGTNTLRLDCVGAALTFFVNGEEVLSARSGRFARGRVGVRAGGTSSGVTRVAFDDAVISVIG